MENNETPAEESEEFVAELLEGSEPDLPLPADLHNEPEKVVADGDFVQAESLPNAVPVPAQPSSVVYDPTVLVPSKPSGEKPPPSAFENLAAKGGAIGAMVLGVLSFVGSFITSYAILNSFLGILLGLWGLRSNHQKMAMLGMLICLISAFFCVVEISEWIQTIWPQEEF